MIQKHHSYQPHLGCEMSAIGIFQYQFQKWDSTVPEIQTGKLKYCAVRANVVQYSIL